MKNLKKRITRLEAATKVPSGEWLEPEEDETTGAYMLRLLDTGLTFEEILSGPPRGRRDGRWSH
ncbi:MAG: hypothetical protein QF787_10165 [Nitrospinota bacterium]|jgi:hypothetical protein|nr:hypothetical protein [Nitrospinota bacterium]MDP6366497.1 hypothetical protein [Nitrospinota bacterium]MDP7370198.1 hypothetical protein [Nitrospinota bacterium]MDP7503943.1 hypothetical protein [Nitrospinota bacterium]MDP7662866.1 hypothetical protein [Nitrospinota bacterium]